MPVQGPDISPIQRLVLAFYAFFAILFRADVAAAVYRLREARRAGAPLPGPEHAPNIPSAPARAPAPPAEPTPAIAGPAGRAAAPSTPVTAAPAPVPPPAQGPAAGQIQAKGVTAAKQAEAAKPPETSKPIEVKPTEPTKPAEVKTPEAVKPSEAVKPTPELKPVPSAPSKAAEPAKPAAAPVLVPPPAPDPRAALQLLAVLQREGRLVDFIEEDLAGFPDASIGAAARTVHAGCKRAIEEYFRLEPVFREPEGARVTVSAGFDPAAVRLTGNVVGAPPFTGALRHHGWRAREVKLPPAKDGVDQTLVAPAEVEL